MVMRGEYTYERVLEDSTKYPLRLPNGKFHEWWARYLTDEGFAIALRPLSDLRQLPARRGDVAGLVTFGLPHLSAGHVVVADEIGIVDPATGAPNHADIDEYFRTRLADGAHFDDEFLAIRLQGYSG